MVETKKELIALIDAEQDQHLELLQDLIRTPSPNPPGDTRDAIEIVRKYLARYSIRSEIIDPKATSPKLVSTLQDDPRKDTRHLILNSHIDQFPVDKSEQWKRSPYSSDIDGGFVHGRGSVDMKAGTAASIIAFTYLHRFRAQLHGQAVLEVVSDEETGGKFGTKYLLEQDERKPLWRGGCVLNAEPDGLSSIRVGEKGTLRMAFNVECVGRHGAYLNKSEGAIRIAARLIARLVDLEQLPVAMDPELKEYLLRPDVSKVAYSIMGPGAADLMLRPSVNVGTIQGGTKVNMIPSSCTFEVDIRLPTGLVAEDVLSHIDSILKNFPGVTYEVQQAATNRAAASPLDHEIVRLLQSNVADNGSTKPLPIFSLGATDCKHFRYCGMPAYTYGPSPETMAEKDEKVGVQGFLDTVKVHTLTAWDYLH
ncbi:hypothetical protein LTR09_010928 [Extremus antarcticus]|uniref:Peptidase M20 dimerisation domain-containing protein n=1 Tax=Extremus antarcticus TaxID=702011 RepID=A0AAJ0DCV2_9PEZI|nr:hypothetical protein LTR09_010928 [Extremus antarcticus]